MTKAAKQNNKTLEVVTATNPSILNPAFIAHWMKRQETIDDTRLIL